MKSTLRLTVGVTTPSSSVPSFSTALWASAKEDITPPWQTPLRLR